MTDDNIAQTSHSLFPRQFKQWIGAAIGFAVLGGLVALAVIATGVVNLGAVKPHLVPVAHVLHTTFQRSVAARAEAVPETIALDDPALILAGAGHYSNVCANCHGAPGLGQNPIALSMRPEPPTLIRAAERYEPGELFVILRDGVRMTAMPAWPVGDRSDEVWAMVAFLNQLPTMDHTQYMELAFADTKSQAPWANRATRADAEKAQDSSRPYLAGDTQSAFTSDEATLLPAVGFTDTRAMGDIADSCVKCHGVDGAGRENGLYPNLTLQSPEYLEEQLRDFATGTRQSGIMWTVAANLSDVDIKNLAQQFGSKPAMPSLGPVMVADDALIAKGEQIASNGITVENATGDDATAPANVQACNVCHVIAAANVPSFPTLAGQNPLYLKRQLQLFRNATWHFEQMNVETHNLEDTDIDALVAYFASLPAKKPAF